MSVRAMTWAAVLATASLAPARAGAFQWAARTGVEYGRDDTWSATGERTKAPRLDLNLALDMSGFIAAPGVLTYGGGVEYRRLSSSVDGGGDTLRDFLTYRLRSALFPSPRSPFTLSVAAQRLTDDLEIEGVSAVDRAVTTSYGAEAALQAPDRPFLRLGYHRDELEHEGPRVGLATRTSDTISASTGFGSSVYTYTASYRGTFSEGTFATDNRDDHRVDVAASIGVAKNLDLRLSDTFFLRVPTSTSALNPRQEHNAFTAALQYRHDFAAFQTGRYQYIRAFQTAPGGEDLERESQRLGYTIQAPLPNPEWRIRGNVDLGHTRNRVGDAEEQSTGQTLGTTVYWRRTRPAGFAELRAGPSVGLLEPEGRDVEYGYGAAAGGTIGRSWAAVNGQLSYDASYQSDLVGDDGSSFHQQLSGSADGPLAGGIARAQVLASAERRMSRLFGDGASRSLAAIAGYSRGRYAAQLQLGLREGIVGSIAESVSGDGLFLPAPYNSHVLYGTLNASARLTRFLSARALLRRTSSDLPDRPTLDESEARASIHLNYGALGLALEERYVIAETPGGTGKFNQVWIRAYRMFGSRY